MDKTYFLLLLNMFFGCLGSFLWGSLGALLIYKYGAKFGLTDIPNERSSHSTVVPRGGGIGILLSFVFYSLYFSLDLLFWIPVLVLSGVSFFGDKYPITPRLRLYVQFACSLLFLIGLFYGRHVDLLLYILVLPVSIFMVGTANFYNFMDGINGISGLASLVAFALLGYYGSSKGFDGKYLIMCGVIMFSCIGFLPFNLPLARVFMGDVGSIFLGFVFSCMVILFSRSVPDFIILCSFLLPFYMDELSTLLIRIKDKDKLSMPHRKHLYQLLANELKVPHWKVSLIYALTQIMVGITVLILQNNIYFVILLIICYGILFWSYSYMIRRKVSILSGRG